MTKELNLQLENLVDAYEKRFREAEDELKVSSEQSEKEKNDLVMELQEMKKRCKDLEANAVMNSENLTKLEGKLQEMSKLETEMTAARCMSKMFESKAARAKEVNRLIEAQ